MNCAELTNDLLLDYADWQLPPHERNRIGRHLDGCPLCQTRRDDLEGMAGALRHDRETAPAGFFDELDAATLGPLLEAEPRPVPKRPAVRWPYFAAGAAAALLIGVIALVAFPGARTRPEAPPMPVAAPPAPREETPAAVQTGDLNGDGTVDIADARILQQIVLAGLPAPSRADVNGDGTVDVADVRLITRHEVAAR